MLMRKTINKQLHPSMKNEIVEQALGKKTFLSVKGAITRQLTTVLASETIADQLLHAVDHTCPLQGKGNNQECAVRSGASEARPG